MWQTGHIWIEIDFSYVSPQSALTRKPHITPSNRWHHRHYGRQMKINVNQVNSNREYRQRSNKCMWMCAIEDDIDRSKMICHACVTTTDVVISVLNTLQATHVSYSWFRSISNHSRGRPKVKIFVVVLLSLSLRWNAFHCAPPNWIIDFNGTKKEKKFLFIGLFSSPNRLHGEIQTIFRTNLQCVGWHTMALHLTKSKQTKNRWSTSRHMSLLNVENEFIFNSIDLVNEQWNSLLELSILHTNTPHERWTERVFSIVK